MTQDDIIRMAVEAGGCTPEWDDFWELHEDALERFAALVAAAEREACAKVAGPHLGGEIAAAIRARGE
jgi:hypothetical protein